MGKTSAARGGDFGRGGWHAGSLRLHRSLAGGLASGCLVDFSGFEYRQFHFDECAGVSVSNFHGPAQLPGAFPHSTNTYAKISQSILEPVECLRGNPPAIVPDCEGDSVRARLQRDA